MVSYNTITTPLQHQKLNYNIVQLQPPITTHNNITLQHFTMTTHHRQITTPNYNTQLQHITTSDYNILQRQHIIVKLQHPITTHNNITLQHFTMTTHHRQIRCVCIFITLPCTRTGTHSAPGVAAVSEQACMHVVILHITHTVYG